MGIYPSRLKGITVSDSVFSRCSSEKIVSVEILLCSANKDNQGQKWCTSSLSFRHPLPASKHVSLRKVPTTNAPPVFSSKAFPGMSESTFLSRSFGDQGVRLRIRKEPRTLLWVPYNLLFRVVLIPLQEESRVL